jgi:hypothetical protein
MVHPQTSSGFMAAALSPVGVRGGGTTQSEVFLQRLARIFINNHPPSKVVRGGFAFFTSKTIAI